MTSYVKHMTCWQSIIFPTGTRLYCFDEGRGQYKMISWIGFPWWRCTFERLSNLWSFAHLSCRPCSSCLDAPRLRGETPCLDTPLLRGRHPVLTLLSRHSSFEGEIPCLDTPLLRGRHPVSALLVWGGVIMCTLQNFEFLCLTCTEELFDPRCFTFWCYHRARQGSCKSSARAGGRPLRVSARHESEACSWFLKLGEEIPHTYPIPTWKHLFSYTKHRPTRKHTVTGSEVKTLVFTH